MGFVPVRAGGPGSPAPAEHQCDPRQGGLKTEINPHAVNAGNDYPYETLGQFNNTQDGTDAWNEFYGQCDSFAAWKAYENLAGPAAQHPGSVPAPGWTPSNASVSPVNQFTWGPDGGKYGNADVWAAKFAALGYTVPTPGAIAYWPNAVTDPQDGNPPDAASGIGEFGHVAFVSDVYPDGSITIEQYNMRENGEYSLGIFKSTASGALWVELGNEAPSGMYVAADPLAFVVDPGCAGLPGRPAPAGATLVGLNDNSAWFSTTGDWNSGIGHGFYNHDLWIPTTASGTASSTATWNAFLNSDTCYNVSAWVPNNYYADNTQASYQVMVWNGGNGAGGPFGTVNQNDIGDAWAPIGQVTTQTGEVSVTLGNTGNSGSYTAADELAFSPC
jgi:surface antigen